MISLFNNCKYASLSDPFDLSMTHSIYVHLGDEINASNLRHYIFTHKRVEVDMVKCDIVF